MQTGSFALNRGMLTLELSSIVLEIPNDVHDIMRIGFCKILKIKCSQMKILILLSLCEISLHNRWYFSLISVIKIELLQKKQTSIWRKNSFIVFFAISWMDCILNLPYLRQLQYATSTSWKFQTNHTDRQFVVWVRVNRGEINISLQSNAAWKLPIFTVWR